MSCPIKFSRTTLMMMSREGNRVKTKYCRLRQKLKKCLCPVQVCLERTSTDPWAAFRGLSLSQLSFCSFSLSILSILRQTEPRLVDSNISFTLWLLLCCNSGAGRKSWMSMAWLMASLGVIFARGVGTQEHRANIWCRGEGTSLAETRACLANERAIMTVCGQSEARATDIWEAMLVTRDTEALRSVTDHRHAGAETETTNQRPVIRSRDLSVRAQ